MATESSVLIVGPAWVGDMVMAQSLFKWLQARRPGLSIDVLAPPWSEPVLARMPEVRRTWPLAVAHGQLGLGPRWQLGRRLREQHYDQAIVLPRSLKAALVPWFAGVPRRTGFRTEMRYGVLNDLRPLDRSVLDQTVKRFLALGLEPGEALPAPPEPRLEIDAANCGQLRQRLGLRDEGAIAMMPGAAYGPAKCWPLESYGALAARIGRSGRQVWVLGSRAEHAAGEVIRQQGGDAVLNLCGVTELADTVDLLSMSAAAVTNDSGLMHVAAAAGTRVIAIYGSSSPAYTPPLTTRREIFYLDLDCSPCFKRDCPLGHLNCLHGIRPDDVWEAVARATG